jgi:ribosomal-protein-alanine N-acetyltransferase
MVARPPVAIVVDRMTVEDLIAVHVIERESFSTPWPAQAYRQEIEQNRLAHYIVARYGNSIVGFAGIWLLVDEAHITTFATRSPWRRRGIGERLLVALLDLALARGAKEATLEVRPSNIAAKRLYEKYGFKVVGVRPRYYSDNNEDALIMTTDSLDGRPMKDRLAELRMALAARPDIELGLNGLPIDRTETPNGAVAADASADGSGSAGAGSSSSIPGPNESRESRIIRPSGVSRNRP